MATDLPFLPANNLAKDLATELTGDFGVREAISAGIPCRADYRLHLRFNSEWDMRLYLDCVERFLAERSRDWSWNYRRLEFRVNLRWDDVQKVTFIFVQIGELGWTRA